MNIMYKNCIHKLKKKITGYSIKKTIFSSILFFSFSALSFAKTTVRSNSKENFQNIIFGVTPLLVGLTFMYFGYKLFKLGITEKSGNMNVQARSIKLIVQQAAPGTIFTICGAVIIIVAIIKKLPSLNCE